MPFTALDLIDGLRDARRHFRKHLRGLSAEQWTWKPYPECKSVLETVVHLVSVDRGSLHSFLETPNLDFASLDPPERDPERLLELLAESHAALVAHLTERYGDAPLEAEVAFFGGRRSLGRALAFLPSEDYYHSGQVAFIRMATDPKWDYYAEIYGP